MEVMLNIGFGVYVPSSHIIGMYNAKDNFGRKYLRQLRENGLAKDISGHRGVRSLIEMDNSVIFLSAYPTSYMLSMMNDTKVSQEDMNLMKFLLTNVYGTSKKDRQPSKLDEEKGKYKL